MTAAASSPRLLAAAGLTVLALLAGACSDGGGDTDEAAPDDTFGVVEPTGVDERCDDPEGDLLTASGASVAEPSGIDLVSAEAVLADDVMTVSWNVAGDPAAVESAWFTVLQGSPGEPLSWELRVDTDDAGRWRTLLLTNERVTDDPRVIRRQEETPLPVVPSLDGGTVRVEVPSDLLPTVASVSWMFGSAMGGEEDVEAVFDDCSNLYSPSGTAPAAPAPDENGGSGDAPPATGETPPGSGEGGETVPEPGGTGETAPEAGETGDADQVGDAESQVETEPVDREGDLSPM